MPDDYRYDNGDRVLLATGDYESTPGQGDMMAREMQSDTMEIDGQTYGNRAFKELKRGFDDPADRQLLVRYYTEVGNKYVDGGGIKDLEITIDDADGVTGTAIRVQAFDVMRNRTIDTSLPFVRLS